ncbi:MAG: ATP-dependent DNA helicase RecQ [Deltaproteobacteria bacterium]|jgi:ATP-dependent DNA helicase RecQ|nr:ATP-dependent DNA helicase RecQ [Deltaproteobacteria bacterium]MBW2536337.1 ATP-dependent DNA helicase RecQ [Deltaproteobacteria bacterium]
MDLAIDLHYPASVPSLRDTLRERFGLDDFHAWQREAIDELLDRSQQVLVVAPTGGGKSLCYQLPAVVLGGTTVVISPLIALMEDQVQALERRGIAATYLASTLTVEERQRRERALAAGEYQLVYVAPERLASDRAVAMLTRLQPPLVAVDEAHCISQWGHDFRPDYLRLAQVIEALSAPRVLACTATATPAVRDEIIDKLGLRADQTAVILRGFARPNLHLSALEIDSIASRRRAVLGALRRAVGAPDAPKGAAIVYAGTRKNTDQLAQLIAEQGWRTAAYHAGLEPAERDRVSRAFADRDLEVVVATNAFGMGIDRPDIRGVIHLQAPGSIEHYYQEVGRAGRDGQPAFGVLLSGSGDFGLRRRLIERSAGDGPDVEPDPERMRWQWKLFLDLMRYVESGSCRHDYILRYFGDEQETLGGCGHCDVCERLELLGDAPAEEPTTLVRQALSAVARTRARAGLGAVVDMLHGADNERQHRLGLVRLSTYGLMAERRMGWITALMRRLITAGLIDVTTGDFPMPFLTDRGVDAMRGESPIRLLLPPEDVGKLPSKPKRTTRRSRGASPAAAAEPLPPADAELYERLRSARYEAAKARGIPPYIICHNRTLSEIATHRPRSLDEMADIHGMGPARVEAWGELFLGVVTESQKISGTKV